MKRVAYQLVAGRALMQSEIDRYDCSTKPTTDVWDIDSVLSHVADYLDPSAAPSNRRQ
ncbi:MAG: hypothetical protein R2697_16700 [Ilumatobacteraceae bacterium]